MTPCNPRNPLAICPTCERYMPHLPHLAECRPLTVCMDATVAVRNGRCPMHEPKEVPMHWTETTKSECTA